MPVRLEHIRTPTAADWLDLEKIHLDTGSTGFAADRATLEQWLADGGWVMAGRFNDRIIGALLARETANGVELSQAGVRTITQRRGVMHQMLHFVQRWAREEGKVVCIAHCPAALENALQHRDFRRINDSWRYNLPE